MKNNLRIALLLDDLRVPNWLYETIEGLRRLEYVDIVTFVVNEEKPTLKRNRLKTGLYRIYYRIDRFFVDRSDNLFSNKELDLDAANIMYTQPEKIGIRNRFKAETIDVLKDYNLDIILRFGFGIISGDILKVSRHGVWSFHHGDNRINRGGPPGFWELHERLGQVGITLQQLSEDLDGGFVVNRSNTMAHPFSLRQNVIKIYSRSFLILKRSLYQLYNDNHESAIYENQNLMSFYSGRLYKMPTNLEMIHFLLRLLNHYTRALLRRFFFKEQWVLYYKRKTNTNSGYNLFNFNKLGPVKDRFWADPFVLEEDQDDYIFFEDFIHSKGKGVISFVKIDDKGNVSSPLKVLDEPYHLSYPFVFKENGQYYMIPETKQANKIILYKAHNFPYDWRKEKILIDNIKAVDTTLLKFDNKYWLFTNVDSLGLNSSHDELCIFWAESLSSAWTKHKLNPIISDCSRARPAGALYLDNGGLFRPSQVNVGHYGKSIKIWEVLELTTEKYQERLVSSIEPEWRKSIFATHTINKSSNLVVLDACETRIRFW